MTCERPSFLSPDVSPITPDEAADRYDIFLLDVWGVLHDGKRPYPGTRQALRRLTAERGKTVILITNAPRSKAMVRRRMRSLGFADSDYTDLVSSGETAAFMAERGDFRAPGDRYFIIGGPMDGDVLAGSPRFRRVKSPDDADFLFVTGYGGRFPGRDAVTPLLERAYARGLPMLSANPDMLVVSIDGMVELCAGDVAALYRSAGGTVVEAGKPYPEIYALALQRARANGAEGRVLCVGDNPATDVAGALAAKLDVALALSGVCAFSETARNECAIFMPRYYMNGFY